MLEVAGLRAAYGAVEVLHGIDLTVGDGEIVVVLGANGAGKTTLLRAISGLGARRGSVSLDDREIVKLSLDAIVRLGVALVPQGRGTFTELTVEENLRVGASARGCADEDLEQWYRTFPLLGERRNQKAGNLSGGQQQMLAIARALMSRPRLLLCDEPSLGLAPLVTEELFRVLESLNRDLGMAVLLVEQNANLALGIAARAYVLERGEVVASGAAHELRHDDAVKSAYLGA